MPLLGEQSNSNGRPYSVSVRALLEFMYIEINRGSFSFYCSHVAPLKKKWPSSQSLNYYLPECTVPSNEWNIYRVCLALRSNQPVFHFFFILFKWLSKLCSPHSAGSYKNYKRPVPDYRPVSIKHLPLATKGKEAPRASNRIIAIY